MYRDLRKIRVVPVGDDNEARKFCKRFQKPIIVGHENMMNGINFAESFYLQFGISPSKMISSFYIERDMKEEYFLWQKLTKKEPFILIHEDIERGFVIRHKLLPEGIRRVYVLPYSLIFHYIGLIFHAEEIHCIDSSFINLVNVLDIEVFYHKYARKSEASSIRKGTIID